MDPGRDQRTIVAPPHAMDRRTQAAQEFSNYRFSSEEMKVIKECEMEALYKRCMPFGIIGGVGAYVAVQRGLLRANPKYGAVPKMIGFAVFGYIFGRASYQKVCLEKLLQLPGSQFAQIWRQHNMGKGGASSWSDTLSINTDPGVTAALSMSPFQSQGDQRPDSLNLDTSRPEYNGLDDYTPSMEGSNNLDDEVNIPASKRGISYDELREKHRAEFWNSRNQPPKNQQPTPGLSPIAPIPAQDDLEHRPINRRLREPRDEQQSGQKNKYGDTWTS